MQSKTIMLPVVTEKVKNDLTAEPRTQAATRWHKGTGIANGTFGELLQGALRNNDDHFLVTLPIRKFSTAVFVPDTETTRISVSPSHKLKSQRLAQRLLEHYGHAIGGQLTIESELPEGKGMASSSADLVATVRALEASLGHPIPDEVVLAMLSTIEPTDGVMYDEFVTFFHRRVELGSRLGIPAGLRVVAIDEGGEIDTIEYNLHNHLFTDEECAEYAELLREIEQAIRENDLIAIGRVSTRSAVLNQKRNPNRHLAEVITISRESGALGVVAAHSGPCLGLLFPDSPSQADNIARAEALLAQLPGKVFIVDSLAPADVA